MSRLRKISQISQRRTKRVRTKIHGTADRPRLSVNISNRQVTAQIINDDSHETLVYATSTGKPSAKLTITQLATDVGQQIGTKAKTKKITKVVFDRGGKLYHGRIKALAEAARDKGLEF